jgi:hypothetical protein
MCSDTLSGSLSMPRMINVGVRTSGRMGSTTASGHASSIRATISPSADAT